MFNALISLSIQLLPCMVWNVVVIVKLVSLFCVLKELSQMDRQQLVVLSTTRISPAPAVGVLAWAARRA
jgi:hypothetical protein